MIFWPPSAGGDTALVPGGGGPLPYLSCPNSAGGLLLPDDLPLGSCSPQKRRITLSTRLIHLPLLAIQGVVIHEYAHLAVPNHSARFYDLVRQLMPTYPAAAALLKGG